MGFTLTIVSASVLVDVDTAKRLTRWLGEQASEVNWSVPTDPRVLSFPFVLTTLEDEPIFVHEEVGWPWWQILLDQMTLTLGPKNVPSSSYMQALFGLAVPFDIKNRHLIEFEPKRWKWHQRIIMKLIAKSGKVKLTDEIMFSTAKDTTAVRNLRIGSIPKILAEVEHACKSWGLPENEQEGRKMAEEMYEAMPEDDVPISRCYALMVRSFLRYAVEHKHIVWFIK